MPVSCTVTVVVAMIVVAAVLKWQRCTFYFSRHSRLVVLVSGFVLEICAIARWEEWQPWSSVLAGVGGSVLATVLVGFLGSDADEVYQAFLRHGVTRFYPNREQSHVDWVGKLSEAKHQCILFGQESRHHSHVYILHMEGQVLPPQVLHILKNQTQYSLI